MQADDARSGLVADAGVVFVIAVPPQQQASSTCGTHTSLGMYMPYAAPDRRMYLTLAGWLVWCVVNLGPPPPWSVDLAGPVVDYTRYLGTYLYKGLLCFLFHFGHL